MRRREFSLLAVAAMSTLSACGGGGSDFEPSVVIQWNLVALDAISAHPRPTVNSRALFLLHTAMYDAWAAYHPYANGTQWGGQLRRPNCECDEMHKRVAISYAAYRVLVQLFPEVEQQTGAFSALMRKLDLPTDAASLALRDADSPVGIGNLAAEALLAARLSDGSNQAHDYAEIVSPTYPTPYAPVNSADPSASNAVGGASFDPARWQPLRVPTGALVDPVSGLPIVDDNEPSSFHDQTILTPHWGAVTPFGMTAGSEFRAPPPPMPGSAEAYTDGLGVTMTNEEAYARQVDEIVTLTAQLTERHKVMAEYWADGPASVTPPGHWNEFAADVSFKYRYGIDEDVRLFFALNGALLDSAISCWECKRHYDFIRPVSAIRHRYFDVNLLGWAGPGLGTQTMPGSQWRPFQSLTFVTPAFPEYTSGHSTFSAAGAEVLRAFTGSDELYDGRTRTPYDRDGDGVGDLVGEYIARPGSLRIEPGLPSEPLSMRWETLTAAADDAGFSRRVGGIHFQDGDLFGRRVGEHIGLRAIQRAREYWNGVR
jgi:hypothetical protein